MKPDDLIPTSKTDLERVDALVQAGPKAAEPILAELLTWLQDINWPVAAPLAEFLVGVGEPLIPHVRKILTSEDDMWIYWILQYVVERLPSELVEQLQPELLGLVEQGERAENHIVATRILAKDQIGDLERLRHSIRNLRRALLDLASDLEEIEQLLPIRR